MSLLAAIVLGVVEGATEFIPVSSSGHLIIVRHFLGLPEANSLSFDAVLQLAAAFALVVYFWKDISLIFLSLFKKESDKTFLWAMVFGTIPAILFGLFLENKMETVFRNVNLVALALVFGSLLMGFAERLRRSDLRKQEQSLTVGRGIIVGLFQCLALVPGVSRSGATISGGLISGLKKDEAVRFSFILSVPILLGAGFKKFFEIQGSLESFGGSIELILGAVAAFLVGLLSISFLIKYLKNNSLNVFIWYRIILAVLLIMAL